MKIIHLRKGNILFICIIITAFTYCIINNVFIGLSFLYKMVTRTNSPLHNGLKEDTAHYKLLVVSLNGYESITSLDAFNGIKNIVYWHEPMTVWERINKKRKYNDIQIHKADPLNLSDVFQNYSKSNYHSSADFYNEVLSCKFSSKIKNYFMNAVIRCPEYIIHSGAISKIFRCNRTEVQVVCTLPNNITQEMNKLCRTKMYNVIVKERVEKMALLGTIYRDMYAPLKSSLLVLQLLRDPRAVIYDLSKHGDMPRNVNEKTFVENVKYICRRPAENHVFGMNNLSQTNNYLLYHYEHLKGMAVTKLLWNILKIESSVLESESSFEYHIEFEQVSNSELNKWRQDIPMTLNYAVENICWQLFLTQPYISIGNNEEALRGNKLLIRYD